MNNKKIKVLFFGLGSIGQRYLRILSDFKGKKFSFFAIRIKKNTPFLNKKNIPIKKNIENIYKIKNINYSEITKLNPKIIFITNPSSFHIDTVLKLKNLKNAYIFIEKPLDTKLYKIKKLLQIIKKNKLNIFYSSNLRFSDEFKYLKKIISTKLMGKIYYNLIKYSQHLKTYHPYENFKKSYTSIKKLGGGINFTSIHEIDLVNNLFKNTKKIKVILKKIALTKLDINDFFVGTFKSKLNGYEIMSLLILDHFQSSTERYFNLVCEKGEVKWDIYNNRITILRNNKKIIKQFNKNKNNMYINQIKFFYNLIKKNKKIPKNFNHINGIECLKLSIN